ncbi:MAG TPA: twin-arginine translocase TatA/TatE family subunit [Actinomycetota bacterium]|nr:twin-arginine translocase TatA/TatE family subunit [Actinomycetota bacterium]
MIAYTVGWPELVIILAVLLLLFGAKRLPEIARSVGKSTKEFKKGMREGGEADEGDQTDETGTPESKTTE